MTNNKSAKYKEVFNKYLFMYPSGNPNKIKKN